MNNRTIVLLAVKSISRETFVPRTMTQGRVLQPGTRRAVTVEEDPVIDTVSIIIEWNFKSLNLPQSWNGVAAAKARQALKLKNNFIIFSFCSVRLWGMTYHSSTGCEYLYSNEYPSRRWTPEYGRRGLLIRLQTRGGFPRSICGVDTKHTDWSQYLISSVYFFQNDFPLTRHVSICMTSILILTLINPNSDKRPSLWWCDSSNSLRIASIQTILIDAFSD